MTLLSSLGISPSVIAKLSALDFVHDSDVSSMKPSELAAVASLTLKESAEVIRLALPNSDSLLSQSVSLKDLIEKEEELEPIITFCEAIDNLLGGGIPRGAITEISGSPGIGKTQMWKVLVEKLQHYYSLHKKAFIYLKSMQACISVQLPEIIGGVEGEAVYIDTEGSFSILRLKEMAEWAAKHIKEVHKTESTDISHFSACNILERIYYFRCHSYLELMAVVKNLYSFLEEHGEVKLIVIDSIAFHFRHDFSDMMMRTSLLCSLTQDLIDQASRHKLSVVVTNQMTTKIDYPGCSQIITALGDTWGHCPTVRLLLHWTGCSRTAKLVKSPSMPVSSVFFQVTAGGIRDKRQDLNQGGLKRKQSDE